MEEKNAKEKYHNKLLFFFPAQLNHVKHRVVFRSFVLSPSPSVSALAMQNIFEIPYTNRFGPFTSLRRNFGQIVFSTCLTSIMMDIMKSYRIFVSIRYCFVKFMVCRKMRSFDLNAVDVIDSSSANTHTHTAPRTAPLRIARRRDSICIVNFAGDFFMSGESRSDVYQQVLMSLT